MHKRKEGTIMRKLVLFLSLSLTIIIVVSVCSFAQTKCVSRTCCEVVGSLCEDAVLVDEDGIIGCDDDYCYRCDDGASSGFCAVSDTSTDTCYYRTGSDSRAHCGERDKYECSEVGGVETCSNTFLEETEYACDPLKCTETECD